MLLIGPTLAAFGILLAVFSGNTAIIAFCVAMFVVTMTFTVATMLREP